MSKNRTLVLFLRNRYEGKCNPYSRLVDKFGVVGSCGYGVSTLNKGACVLEQAIAKRHLHLCGQGVLLVNTDLHGNGDDFRQMRQLFYQERERGLPVYWVLLGDLVHGPDPLTQKEMPELYGYADESAWIVQEVCSLLERFPDEVFFVLGNHDYAHIGGRATRKFYPDEAAHLESTMSSHAIQKMHDLFQNAFLGVTTTCGVMLAHGSPDGALKALHDLDNIPLPCPENQMYFQEILSGFLESYGQRGEVTSELLARLSSWEKLSGTPLRWLIHGHDKDESGWFTEGGNQLCPVLFGAPNKDKRYLRIELEKYNHSLDELLDEDTLRFLHR